MMKQILICQPLGGFIDVCNEIICCLHFCERNKDCFLYIDTNLSSLNKNIFNYFDFFHEKILQNYKLNIKEEKETSFYPKEDLEYFLNEEKTKKKKIILTDLTKDYKEKFILRSNGAYGPFFLDFMKITKLKENVLEDFHYRYKLLNNNFFVGIHIRNTDYKSDFQNFYKKLLQSIKINRNTTIFLSTDDSDVIKYFFEKKDFKNIFTFSFIPKLENKMIGLHNLKNIDDEKKNQMNIDMLCDFFLLLISDEFFYSCSESGFSKTIYYCKKQVRKKKILFDYLELT